MVGSASARAVAVPRHRSSNPCSPAHRAMTAPETAPAASNAAQRDIGPDDRLPIPGRDRLRRLHPLPQGLREPGSATPPDQRRLRPTGATRSAGQPDPDPARSADSSRPERKHRESRPCARPIPGPRPAPAATRRPARARRPVRSPTPGRSTPASWSRTAINRFFRPNQLDCGGRLGLGVQVRQRQLDRGRGGHVQAGMRGRRRTPRAAPSAHPSPDANGRNGFRPARRRQHRTGRSSPPARTDQRAREPRRSASARTPSRGRSATAASNSTAAARTAADVDIGGVDERPRMIGSGAGGGRDIADGGQRPAQPAQASRTPKHPAAQRESAARRRRHRWTARRCGPNRTTARRRSVRAAGSRSGRVDHGTPADPPRWRPVPARPPRPDGQVPPGSATGQPLAYLTCRAGRGRTARARWHPAAG